MASAAAVALREQFGLRVIRRPGLVVIAHVEPPPVIRRPIPLLLDDVPAGYFYDPRDPAPNTVAEALAQWKTHATEDGSRCPDCRRLGGHCELHRVAR